LLRWLEKTSLAAAKSASGTEADVIRTRAACSCLLCGREGRIVYQGVRDRSLFVPGSWSFRVCKDCDFAWLDPHPIPEDVALAYAGEYYTHNQNLNPISLGRNPLMRALRGAVLSARYGYTPLRPNIPFAGLLGWLLSRIPLAHRRATLGRLRAIPPYRPHGRILEIGCGHGDHLLLMRELGWECHGIEPDPVAAERAARMTGAKIWRGTIETAETPPQSFDAVFSLHSIEHVYDPRLFISRAVGFLRPGGFLYLITPNFRALARRIFHEDWFAFEPPRHLNLLTPTSVRSICGASGCLRVRSIRTLARRARREREQVYAVRRTGDFNAELRLSPAQRLAVGWFSLLEKMGNSFFEWGEEIELIAERSSD
jgi:2-polyprenyl-3-methyl-5-hydroxy-6-metoxy-1,4-benzoquinol methylase